MVPESGAVCEPAPSSVRNIRPRTDTNACTPTHACPHAHTHAYTHAHTHEKDRHTRTSLAVVGPAPVTVLGCKTAVVGPGGCGVLRM